jgi:hypothetical protein
VTDLVAFLNARLDEDEAAARDAYYEGQRWITEEEGVYRWPDDELVQMADRKRDARHIARHDPARVLREVEADRKLIAAYEAARSDMPPVDDWYEVADGIKISLADGLESALKIRAERFSDHPGYDEAWTP